MKSILFTFTFCFLTLVVLTQNVGINTLNPLEDLHVRADSSQIAIRMDNKKSVMGGTNYFSAIGIPSSVQVGFYNNPNYQNWTDLVHSKIVDSDNVRLNSPEIAIWPDAANSFRINFNFSPSIPSNATILDMTFHAEWRRIGTYAGEMHIGNTGLYKASNNLKLIDYGFERITNSTDLVITMPVKEIVNQVTPDMINLSDCYIMFNILTSVINGLSRLEIDKAWIEVVYSLPASGSENVSWSTGIVNGKYIISNSGDLGTNQHLTIDEAGIVQVKV